MITIEQIKEYIKCPQFGDIEYGKWGALKLEQREAYKHLIDIIEGQDKEIERLNNKVDELMTLYTTEREVKEDYKSIIKEVREKIKNHLYAKTILSDMYSDNEIFDFILEKTGDIDE